MIDPFVSLFMPQDDQAAGRNDASNFITVEEAIDCRDSNSRLFTLSNKNSQLSIVINDKSTMTSCNLGGHEIVVDKDLYRESHETWAVGERPFQKLSGLSWASHVRGSELILSSNTNSASNNNPHTSLHFDLTRSNELHCVAKLRTIHLQHQVLYYNLNRALRERTPIDGHTIVVRCNGNLNRIQVQPTKLLCHCNKRAPVLPQSLISHIPFELRQDQENPNSDDLILCDAIFCLESLIGSPDYLQAQLQYRNRVLVIEVRSAKSTTLPANSANSVSSSSSALSVTRTTSAAAAALPIDLMHMVPANTIESTGESSSGTSDDSIATSSSGRGFVTRMKLEPLDSTSCNRSADAPPICSMSPSSTMLRLRIRVTNFGVSILPIMMTNYATTLSFSVM